MDGTGMSPAGTWCSVPAGVPDCLPWQHGGPSKHQGGTWGHTTCLGASTCCLAPLSTHGKAGGTRRAGVARLPWRSLCRRTMLSHLQCPSQVPKAHGAPVSPLSPPPTPLTGSPLAPASPAGPRSPWRPFGGRREELQRVPHGPCPGLCPPGSTARQGAGTKDPIGSVISTSPCRPQPARHLRAPGRTRSAPGWAPSSHGASHVHRAQHPRVAGYPLTDTGHRCGPWAGPTGSPRATGPWKAQPWGGCGGAQLPALPRTRFTPQLQPGATRCLPVPPGHTRARVTQVTAGSPRVPCHKTTGAG